MQLLLDFSSLRGAFLVFPHAGDSGAEEFSVFLFSEMMIMMMLIFMFMVTFARGGVGSG